KVLNQLVYQALGAGAFDAALRAAEKQVKLAPDDPNIYDTLAEVYNYRGDRETALATIDKGLAMKDIPAPLAAAMRDNRARFEKGGKALGVMPPGTLSGPLARSFDGSFRPPVDARFAAQGFFSHEANTIAKACGDKAKGFDEAYVRVTIGANHQIEKVQVIEP